MKDTDVRQRAPTRSTFLKYRRGFNTAADYDRCKGSPTKRRVLPVPPSNEKRYSGPFQPRWAIKNPSTDTSSSDEGGRMDNSKFHSSSTHLQRASGLPSHHLSRQTMPPMSSSGGRNSQKLFSNNIQT
uniref:RBPJ-interacting and tubulin-associated protein 1 n=1 Tax=Romanomermis culicivorax TaxID=13658 RepID=A0A915IZ36_ROMCU